MKNRTSSTRNAAIATALMLSIAGCSVMAARVVIKHRKGQRSDSATATVPASPDRVYQAEMQSLGQKEGAEIAV